MNSLLGVGYTYNRNEAPLQGELSTTTPAHMLKAWMNLRLPRALRRWNVGGSLHAQSATSALSDYCPTSGETCAPAAVRQRAYSVVDLRGGFEINANWQIGVSLNNAFDKVYYETIHAAPMYGWYGEPRSLALRINASTDPI